MHLSDFNYENGMIKIICRFSHCVASLAKKQLKIWSFESHLKVMFFWIISKSKEEFKKMRKINLPSAIAVDDEPHPIKSDDDS